MKLLLVQEQRQLIFFESFGEFLNRINSDVERSIKFSINLRELFSICGVNVNNYPNLGSCDGSYVLLSKAEMANFEDQLNGERIGAFDDGVIWMSDTVPEKFREFVLINLVLTAKMNLNTKTALDLRNLFQVSPETPESNVKHWTAMMFDIQYAQKTLSPIDFSVFLSWRKKYEQTEFFSLEVASQVTDIRSDAYTKYKLLVDPRERSWRTKLSFELANQVDLNDQMSHALDMVTTRVDRVFSKLCNKGFEDRFDAFEMLKLLEKINSIYNSLRSKKTFDLKVEDEDTDIQAYLLTEYALGTDALLLQKSYYAYNEYDLRPSSAPTVRALIDRILHFTIRSLNTVIEQKSKVKLLDESGMLRYEYDLRDRLSVERVLHTLRADIEIGEQLLDEYTEVSVLTQSNPELAPLLTSDSVLRHKIETLKQENERVKGLLELSETVLDWNNRMKKYVR